MLAIKNNLMAVNAARYLGRSYDALAQSVERLSSGLRINSAKDDAAGMAVRELMRADIAVIEQGTRNAQDGISMLQTMEGAMATIDTSLVRMKQLAEQAATGSYSSTQREIMNNEFVEMAAEVDRIANSTKFNNISMLNNADEVTIRFGTADADAITVSGADMTKSGLGIDTGSGGTTIESLTANGVDDVDDDTWLTLTDADDDTVTLTLQFTDTDGEAEKAIDVEFAAAVAGSPYSLQDVVDAINLASNNLGNDDEGNSVNYTAAEAVLDAESGKYVLKLSSRTGDADGVTMALAQGDDTNDTVVADGFDSLGDVSGDMQAADTDAAGINILTPEGANDALEAVTAGITAKDVARAAFGYKMNRLENTGQVLSIQAENLMAAESRISDVDVATEMAKMTRNQVLSQAGTAMLAQANAIPQMALTLLR